MSGQALELLCMGQETKCRTPRRMCFVLQISIGIASRRVHRCCLPFTVIRTEIEIGSIRTTVWGHCSENGLQPMHRLPLRAVIFLVCVQTSPLLSQRKTLFTVVFFHFLGTSTVKTRWVQPSQLTLRDWGEVCSSRQQTNWKSRPWTAYIPTVHTGSSQTLCGHLYHQSRALGSLHTDAQTSLGYSL